MSWRTFDVMTNLLTSLRVLDVMTCFSHHDVFLTSWWTCCDIDERFDVMTCIWRHDDDYIHTSRIYSSNNLLRWISTHINRWHQVDQHWLKNHCEVIAIGMVVFPRSDQIPESFIVGVLDRSCLIFISGPDGARTHKAVQICLVVVSWLAPSWEQKTWKCDEFCCTPAVLSNINCVEGFFFWDWRNVLTYVLDEVASLEEFLFLTFNFYCANSIYLRECVVSRRS